MDRRVDRARKAYSVSTERELLRLLGAIAISQFVEESSDGSQTFKENGILERQWNAAG